MPLDPITAGIELGTELIRRWFPDKEEAGKRQLELTTMLLGAELEEWKGRVGIITAEAGSEHWLTSTWRPIVMLSFTALVILHFFGLTAPNISEDQIENLLEIVKYGLSGYIVGRSVEKGIKAWKQPEAK